jgi:hypothetical protein
MATLKKMTRVGADVRQIARLLQAKAPEGHMLAYITPEEAQILKSQGGSGKPHADTGIPSFEDENLSYDMYGESATPTYSEPAYLGGGSPATNLPSMDAPATAPETYAYPSGVFAQPFTAPAQAPAVAETPYMPAGAFPAGAFAPPEGGAGLGYKPYQIDTTPEKGVMERLTEATGMSKETLARLGLAGGLGAYGAYQGKKARQQAEEAKKEQQKLAAPYRQQGAELQRAAQAGELTPQSAQALQAVQAQVAQQASGRGGVGTMQSQAQVETFRQQLLASQYDYGLKLSGIGDNIALGAIKTGLEADRYVQNLSNSFYTNMANIAGGMPAQAQAQQRTA